MHRHTQPSHAPRAVVPSRHSKHLPSATSFCLSASLWCLPALHLIFRSISSTPYAWMPDSVCPASELASLCPDFGLVDLCCPVPHAVLCLITGSQGRAFVAWVDLGSQGNQTDGRRQGQLSGKTCEQGKEILLGWLQVSFA